MIETPPLPAEESSARRARVLEQIGPGAWAVVRGAGEPAGLRRFRQTKEFFYLTGLEVPHAHLPLDGSRGDATLYLAPGYAVQADAVQARRGVERVAPVEQLPAILARACLRGSPPTVYTPLQPAEGAAETRDAHLFAAGRAAADPWDGEVPREARFAEALRRRFPRMEVRDLSGLLDRLRLIKSSAEVDIMRRAAHLCGEGIVAAMRAGRPGMSEYELEAVAAHVFRAGGAEGEGYCAIVASGPNIWEGHYNVNDRVLEAGDLVLMDYAPDCQYYTSDIGRMWPVDGTFRPWQRELYGFIKSPRGRLIPPASAVGSAARALPCDTLKRTLKTERMALRRGIRRRVKRSRYTWESGAVQRHRLAGNGFGHRRHLPCQRGYTFCWRAAVRRPIASRSGRRKPPALAVGS